MKDFSMELIWAKIQMAAAMIGGWLGYFLGGLDGLMIALIIFMVLDYITGLMCAVIAFYLSNEGLSLLENAAHIGLPIPDRMKDVLAQLHGREDKSNDEKNDDAKEEN